MVMDLGTARDIERRPQTGLQFADALDRQFETMLVRVLRHGLRIIVPGDACHLYMRSQQRTNGVRGGKRSDAIDAGALFGHVIDRHVQATGIKDVTRQKDLQSGVVNHDVGDLVPWGWNDAEGTTTKIELANLVRPVLDAEETGHVRGLEPDDDGVGTVSKCAIACDMVAMTVAVRDDERNRSAMMRGQPVCDEAVDNRP